MLPEAADVAGAPTAAEARFAFSQPGLSLFLRRQILDETDVPVFRSLQ